MSEERPVLLVFGDDWGRHPSSCQHLVMQLLNRYRVLWVNTIGMRRPRWDYETLVRGLEKVQEWFVQSEHRHCHSAPTAYHPNLIVLNPRMWPSFGSSWERRINQTFLQAQIVPFLSRYSQPVIAITTIPVVADLVGCLPVTHWVYYCVDDFSEWPGLDGTTIRDMEHELVSKVNTLIAVSDSLQDKLRRDVKDRDIHLLTHGVDLGHWQAGLVQNGDESDWAHLERPLIVFWGLIDRRLDVEYLRSLSRDMSRGTILLVGPRVAASSELETVPRISYHPPVAFHELPAIGQAADCLIMPYADLPVTRAMQPLKLKEYMATGKPVVVSNLPSTSLWSECVDVVGSPDEFSWAVRNRLSIGLSCSQKRARERLLDESWLSKSRILEQCFLARR